MKCPYNTIMAERYQMSMEYDEAGNQTDVRYNYVKIPNRTECLKEDCAVYNNGKCNYKCN